jgi:hypothetical protein
LEQADVELTIDNAKYFACAVDDIDAYQADIKLMNMFADDAAEQMKITIDSAILEGVITDVDSANKGTAAGEISGGFNLGGSAAAVQITKGNVLDYIVDCGTVLDEQNVPESGRWMVIPSWIAGMIKKSDLKDASLTGDGSSVLRNGRIGMIDRFTLYLSNNIHTDTDTWTCYNVLFGTKAAITYASQITKVSSLESETTFGQLIRGLNVYGYKVIKPEALGLLYCHK